MELEDLLIDEEFQSLIPPLTVEEYNQLELNILEEDEVRDPIIVWADHNIIVDGHNRYKVLKDHPTIRFRVTEKPFETRDDVIVWMCANQLGRRNISDTQRTILIGKAYEARKHQGAVARGEHGRYIHTETSKDTRQEIADEFHVKISDVERSGRYVRGLSEVEAAYPGTTHKIQTGELEVVKKDVMALTSMDEDDKQQAIDDIVAGRRIYRPESITSEPVHNEEYTIEDFKSELMKKVFILDKNLELTCILTHKSFLDTEDGKEALREVLLEMTEVIKKYFNLCN